MIDRRAAVGMVATAWLPHVGRAQTPGRVYLKSARVLGVMIPQTILLRADRVIE